VTQISIKEVARIAGVSIATVSRYLNTPTRVQEKTRQKVQNAIAQTGYSPNSLAQNFRRGKSQMVMVVMPSVGDPFLAEVLRSIQETAKVCGYTIMIKEARLHEMTADDVGSMIVSKQADGIILLASISPFSSEILSEHSRQALPVVIGCETVSAELTHFPSIHIDNVAAAEDATNHLLSLNHRRIAFMHAGNDSLLTKDREIGYRNALKMAGVPVEDDLICSGELSIAGAQNATRRLLRLSMPPTAIFCANDEMALGTIYELKASGLKVPENVSVVGFDDTRYAAISDPSLTTIRQPSQEIGRRVFQRLLACIEGGAKELDGPREAANNIVAHQLVVRQSTALCESSAHQTMTDNN